MLLEHGYDLLEQVCTTVIYTNVLYCTIVDPDYFWLLLLGQVVCSVTNILEWSAPSLLSAKWFPPNERAFATASVGATAPQVISFYNEHLLLVIS